MPGEKFVDALVELVGHLGIEVEIAVGAIEKVGIGVFVREAQRGAAAEDPRGAQRECDFQHGFHQKLSTVMWPGARRRCLRRPRSISSAVVSFSMSGLPHSITCELSAASLRPAAASSCPSRNSAGMRPRSDPGTSSRLTTGTYLRF